MRHPRYSLRTEFRPTLTLAGQVHGSSQMVGTIVPLLGLAGLSAGEAQLEAEVNLRVMLAGLSQGLGELTADMTLLEPSLYHIIIIGQSNGEGADTNLFANNPARGRSFAGGLKPGNTGLGSIVPLVEMTGTTGQTCATGLVNWLAANLPEGGSSFFLVSNVAVGGAGYNDLKKGTSPYSNSIAQVSAARNVALSLGIPYKVLGLVCIHGEFDDSQRRAAYRSELVQWQLDYDNDIRAINGQTERVRLFATQMAGAAPEQYNNVTANMDGSSALNLLLASQDAPDKVVCVGPLVYMQHFDGLHMDAVSQTLLGEKMGAVIKQTYFDETPFVPLYCTSAVRTGATVVLTFAVPVPPLRMDYRYTGFNIAKGFAYKDSNGLTGVASADITGPNQVTLTLGGVPTGTGAQVRYQCANTTRPYAGNLVDSSPGSSQLGLPIPNYCVSCFVPVT